MGDLRVIMAGKRNKVGGLWLRKWKRALLEYSHCCTSSFGKLQRYGATDATASPRDDCVFSIEDAGRRGSSAKLAG